MSGMNRSRRRFLGGLGAGAAALTGGGLAGTLPGSAWSQAAKPLAGQTITHWSFLSPEGKSLREQAIREIEARFRERTGAAVAFQTFPWHELRGKLIAAVQAGNPPDNSRVNFPDLKMLMKADALTNLDPYLKASFPDAERKDFVVDFTPTMLDNGSKRSMLLETAPRALVIRKDWFAKAGLKAPRTWNDVVEAGKALTGNGRWGYMFFASKTQLNQVEPTFQPHIHGRGGQVLDASGKAAFNSDAGVRSYQFLADCVHKHKITPTQVVAMSHDDVTDAFKSGRMAMYVEISPRYRDIAAAVGADNIELVKIPSDDPNRPSPSVISGWGLAIPRGAKHADASWEYIKQYVGIEAQEINARVAGSLPTRKSVLAQPFFQTKEAAYMRWWMDYVAERGELSPNVATFNQLNEVMTDALHQVLLRPNVNIKPVLDEAAGRYNQIASA
jgi:ABC-type glycerol-3-phosphate transport system substrate-binding protein